MGDVTHSMKEYFIVGCCFISIFYLPILVNNKMIHFVTKVTGNEGHHHLTFDSLLVH
jgi:hypothetical protein